MLRSVFLAVAMWVSGVAQAETLVPSANFFDVSSVRVKEAQGPVTFLDKCADKLKGDKALSLKISVHADERLGMADNTYLAHERAKSLLKALQRKGAGKKQIVLESVGHTGVERTSTTAFIVFTFSDGSTVAWSGKD